MCACGRSRKRGKETKDMLEPILHLQTSLQNDKNGHNDSPTSTCTDTTVHKPVREHVSTEVLGGHGAEFAAGQPEPCAWTSVQPKHIK